MLASISGGTDICSCFALGNPTLPVRQGELQAFGLGQDACALDRETGEAVVGQKAELACRAPFVAAPVCFFGDDERKSRYRGAYFEEGDEAGTWFHGDLIEVSGSVGASGGVVIHGRSDTTLKPGGVRIGTAEASAARPPAPCELPPPRPGSQAHRTGSTAPPSDPTVSPPPPPPLRCNA